MSDTQDLSSSTSEMDLPLMANAHEIRARHYILHLKLEEQGWKQQSFEGQVIIFLEPLNDTNEKEMIFSENKQESKPITDSDFQCILDCCDISFSGVYEVLLPDKYTKRFVCSKPNLLTFDERKDSETMRNFFSFPVTPLEFKVDDWSIRISKNGCKTAFAFPRVVRLQYQTNARGRSLMWRKSSESMSTKQTDSFPDCVFTPAANINNRSLFPCQEPPIAMATWQCVVTNYASEPIEVLCTGDEDGILIDDIFKKNSLDKIDGDIEAKEKAVKHHYFYTQMVLPMSTFALAIGPWEMFLMIDGSKCKSSFDEIGESSKPIDTIETNIKTDEKRCVNIHEPYPCHIERGDSGPLLPCRIFGPSNLISQITSSLSWQQYIPACLQASYELLGSHPFSKLDLLFLPRCFSGLGLASPNLIFLSPSLLVNRGKGDASTSMLIRLSHEISHSWFGLVIGALDWTEEWLSEGFATFAEDHIHERTMEIIAESYKKSFDKSSSFPLQSEKEFNTIYGYDPCNLKVHEINDIRGHIRFITLKGELESTDAELQVLRPMGKSGIDQPQSYVKNGMNPELSCTQVHYLKGYFLLKHLCALVSKEDFFRLLRKYIHELFHGRLVHSTEFLTLFFDEFFQNSDEYDVKKMKGIADDWLDSKHLPEELILKYASIKPNENLLLDNLLTITKWWKQLDKNFKKRKRKKASGSYLNSNVYTKMPEIDHSLVTEQLVLLLEYLLELNDMSSKTMNLMDSVYEFQHQSPDVQHRFAELIVKHRCTEKLSFIEHFLKDHQSMGIYLYGEMKLSKLKQIRTVAMQTFNELKDEMDPTMAVNVKEMLFNNQN